jgi:hypothetical protein
MLKLVNIDYHFKLRKNIQLIMMDQEILNNQIRKILIMVYDFV